MREKRMLNIRPRVAIMLQGGHSRPSDCMSAAHPLKIIVNKGDFRRGNFDLSYFCPPFLNQEKSSN